MPTLVDLALDHRQLLEQLRDSDDTEAGHVLAGAVLALAAKDSGAALAQKATGYVHVARELRADVAVLDAEIARLQARRSARSNRADWLEDRLLGVLDAAGIDKIESPALTIAVALNPAAVEILDEAKIPDEFRHPVPPPPKEPPRGKPDKVAIRRAFERTGEIVPGTKVGRSKRLAIK